MPVLGSFNQQVGEVMDYYIDYTKWFSTRKDTPLDFTAEVEPGVELVMADIDVPTKRARVILDSTNSTNGSRVKITVYLTTTTGIFKEDDFVVKIKEV